MFIKYVSKSALAFALLCVSQAFAEPQYSLEFTEKQNGQLRVAVVGEDICDSSMVSGKPNKFGIIIHDLENGTKQTYKSGSGNTSWAINCKFNQEIRHDLLKDNVVLELLVLDQSEREIEQAFVQVPCETLNVRSRKTIALGRYSRIQEITDKKVTSCAGGMFEKEEETDVSTQVTVQEQAQQVGCSLSLTREGAQSNRASVIAISGWCNTTGVYSLRATVSDGKFESKVNCRENFSLIKNRVELVCRVAVDNYVSTKVTATMVMPGPYGQRGTIVGHNSATFVKASTFDYSPSVDVLTGESIIAVKEKKSLGRGFYWSTQIRALVSDSDIDTLSNERLRVDLVRLENNAEVVITTAYATAAQKEVRFDLEHQYVTPLLFGSPYHEGTLNMGENKLFLRVYDAYQGNKITESKRISVVVNE